MATGAAAAFNAEEILKDVNRAAAAYMPPAKTHKSHWSISRWAIVVALFMFFVLLAVSNTLILVITARTEVMADQISNIQSSLLECMARTQMDRM